MRIEIIDDFDPKKIQISGQCFRVKETKPGVFRFITGEHVLYIKKAGDDNSVTASTLQQFDISCTEKEWEEIWKPYFDMDRSYSEICKTEYGKHDFSDRAIDFGRGLRILKQDKWEMLISFIISQRKSIPAISSAVEALCTKFGTRINVKGMDDFASVQVDGKSVKGSCSVNNDHACEVTTSALNAEHAYVTDVVYAFPTPGQMANATLEDLKECGLGYRAPYVYDAIRKVNSGELDLEKIDELCDEDLFNALMDVHGVGKKVSNCVCLFAYARMGRAPVDVWISRAIDEEFGGVNPFPEYGENAGIIQQYIFYYEKNFPKMGD